MAKLILKFDSAVLREVPLGKKPVTIGRAPDNDIQIDNLAVSDHHARIFSPDDRLKVEDLNSLNGIAVNGTRATQEWLYSGDVITVGKHAIVVDLHHDVVLFDNNRPTARTPKIEETYVLDRHSSAHVFPQRGEAAGASSASRARVPNLLVLKGKTDQQNYSLSSKLTLIGKSPMATIKLKRWFAPHAAAQISQRKDGYYLSSLSKRVARINGRRVTAPTRLSEGDFIEVAGVSLKFVYPD